jgi:hypothetical protein
MSKDNPKEEKRQPVQVVEPQKIPMKDKLWTAAPLRIALLEKGENED